MKKVIISLALMMMAVAPVMAETRTERECSTDNYGNTTCRDKTTDIQTGVITYSNETTTTVTGGVVNGSTVTGGRVTSTAEGVEILNTSVPGYVDVLAGVVVALGAGSWLVKRAVRR